jgi:hypothetical protein
MVDCDLLLAGNHLLSESEEIQQLKLKLSCAETKIASQEMEVKQLNQERESIGFSLEKASCENKTLHCQLEAAKFQGIAWQILQASVRRFNPSQGAVVKYSCLKAAPESSLHGFGKWVIEAFLDTRAMHVIRYNGSQVFCDPPKYKVTAVEAVTNPELADRFRQFMLHSESRETSSDHQYTAHRVAAPVHEKMRLHCLLEAGEGFNERVLLGWHGSNDEATEEILADGFNPCCNSKHSIFGRGIYFAENSSKADMYAGPKDYKRKKYNGSMSMILTAVNCGNMYETKVTATGWTKAPSPSQKQTEETGIQR